MSDDHDFEGVVKTFRTWKDNINIVEVAAPVHQLDWACSTLAIALNQNLSDRGLPHGWSPHRWKNRQIRNLKQEVADGEEGFTHNPTVALVADRQEQRSKGQAGGKKS